MNFDGYNYIIEVYNVSGILNSLSIDMEILNSTPHKKVWLFSSWVQRDADFVEFKATCLFPFVFDGRQSFKFSRGLVYSPMEHTMMDGQVSPGEKRCISVIFSLSTIFNWDVKLSNSYSDISLSNVETQFSIFSFVKKYWDSKSPITWSCQGILFLAFRWTV